MLTTSNGIFTQPPNAGSSDVVEIKMRTAICGENGDSYNTGVCITSIFGTNSSNKQGHFRDSGIITDEVTNYRCACVTGYLAPRTARKGEEGMMVNGGTSRKWIDRKSVV